MKILAEVIATGWPSDKRLLPDSFKLFFDYRDELPAQDGLTLRGQSIVIHLAKRSEIKQKISRWPPRHKLLPQKSEGPDILAWHVC